MISRMDENEAEDNDNEARALLGDIFGTLCCKHVNVNRIPFTQMHILP